MEKLKQTESKLEVEPEVLKPKEIEQLEDNLQTPIVRCAAHSLSLAVDDDLGSELDDQVFPIKVLVKACRYQSIIRILKQLGVGVPPLEVCVRWLSRFLMLFFVWTHREN